MTSKTKYDKELLQKCMERDGFLVDLDKNSKLTRDVPITFMCRCGAEGGEKVFRWLYKYGGFCKICTIQSTTQKIKETCLKNYGVQNPAQSEEIKQKIKDTCLKIYGVECSLQNEEIKQKVKDTCLKIYGVEHPSQNEEIKQKKKDTCLQNYGVEHPSQSKDIRQKTIQTSLKKYGVKYTLQSHEVRQKGKETSLKKYGVYHPTQNEEIKQKIRDTCLKIYGVECSLQNEEIKQKKKETCLKKYGVDNPMHNAEVSERASQNAYKVKIYTFPDGSIRQVQGYEPFALDLLVHEFEINDIVTDRTKVPEIWYNKHNKKCRYFPDIYISSQNKIIEVKSNWTYEKRKEDLSLKCGACKKNGYGFEVWIFDAKRNLVICDE